MLKIMKNEKLRNPALVGFCLRPSGKIGLVVQYRPKGVTPRVALHELRHVLKLSAALILGKADQSVLMEGPCRERNED